MPFDFDQFKTNFLATLHRWCVEHRASVQACYVPYPPACACAIKVFIVARAKAFDFDLSDAIADLEVQLDSAGWPSDVLQIAAGSQEELQVFFDSEQSIQVYNDGNGSPASAKI